MNLRTSRREVAGVQVLTVEGAADLAALPGLHDALTKLGSNGSSTPQHLAVDLDGTSFVDDAALGLLLGAATRARLAGRSFVVVCSPSPVRERLAVTRFDQVVGVVASLTAAGSASMQDGIDDVS